MAGNRQRSADLLRMLLCPEAFHVFSCTPCWEGIESRGKCHSAGKVAVRTLERDGPGSIPTLAQASSQRLPSQELSAHFDAFCDEDGEMPNLQM